MLTMNTAWKNVLSELRRDQELCDAVIQVGNVEFEVHRIVLCGCSSYFRDLFCSTESASEQVYSFPDVSPHVMSLVLEFAYSQAAAITEENALELLAAAKRFAIKGLIQACCDLLQQNLRFSNCIHIWQFADVYGCVALRQKAYHCILHHFEAIAEVCADFLLLSVQQLADLIENDELNVKQEKVVFEAVLHWISFAPQERSVHIATLLSKVRLLLMPLDYLAHTVSRNPLVKNCPPCIAMVKSALRTLCGPDVERPLTRTRLPSRVLFAFGGWRNTFPTDKMEHYDVRADRWVRLDKEDERFRLFCGCVYLNGFVYCIGGDDGGNLLSSVLRFHLATRTWTEVGPMHLIRCDVTVVELNGCIYALGGRDRTSNLNSAERYEPSTNQWTLIAPMQECRSSAGAAVLHGQVYICGGLGGPGPGAGPLQTAECYNPETNQWTAIEPMETRRYAAGVIAYNNQIYAGGHNTVSCVCSVTAYDPLLERWRSSAPMLRCRQYFGIAVLEDHLYVVGGCDDSEICGSVERYDSKTNKWEVIRNMEMPNGWIRCFVVERQIGIVTDGESAATIQRRNNGFYSQRAAVSKQRSGATGRKSTKNT
uniref:Kelch-like protein 10 n=1 Tax=Stegastes partitus TaxID=144197 RepID=A0A3B5BAH4_9TELE